MRYKALITVFNRTLLYKIHMANQRNQICSTLKQANIEYVCTTRGTDQRAVLNISEVFWFDIYVKKRDYNQAKELTK